MEKPTGSPEAFAAFLLWLAPTPEEAERQYETLRQGLTLFFRHRGCQDEEDLAEDTLLRVAAKFPALGESYQGEPERYCYGVARFVLRETRRRRTFEPLPDDFETPDAQTDSLQKERCHACYETCLTTQLASSEQTWALEYYEGRGQARIENRRALAVRLQIKANDLRVRAHRLRAKLEACLRACDEKFDTRL